MSRVIEPCFSGREPGLKHVIDGDGPAPMEVFYRDRKPAIIHAFAHGSPRGIELLGDLNDGGFRSLRWMGSYACKRFTACA